MIQWLFVLFGDLVLFFSRGNGGDVAGATGWGMHDCMYGRRDINNFTLNIIIKQK